ncbi:alpha/beta hydrolase [Marinobacter zhejiangensis]|uniref:Acetyl esterase/lipase n=1 Tax=Marinobacter zhejiangensis TaxID=488535 RepID=A0A1I4PFU5_9GAMM|nr:alpha/beta hydrolase [Marinobacter zhejiangensis]SFM26568.1 Acetyl esterase/lipase [Marinobacter zhejiangensis]
MRRLLSATVRLFLKPALSPGVPIGVQRAWGGTIGLTLMGPKGTKYQPDRKANVPTMAITPLSQEQGRGVLFIHGGAFVIGGYSSHRKLAAAVGEAAGAQVWLPDYRLAPEHPHPAALEDVLTIYSTLLDEGQDPGKLSIVGDSAGGGLALTLLMAIRDADLPLPASLVLISPWVDLTLSGRTMTSHAKRDPMISQDWLRWAADSYSRLSSPQNPECSPLLGDLTGLPPTLIQVGTEEVLLSDAQSLYQRMMKTGLNCTLNEYEGLWHVFQLHYRVLEKATNAVHDIGKFIKQQTAPEPSHTNQST